MAKGKKPKGKVIDALPRQMKAALNKPRLKDITFEDMNKVRAQLQKFITEDPAGWASTACGLCCTKWGS